MITNHQDITGNFEVIQKFDLRTRRDPTILPFKPDKFRLADVLWKLDRGFNKTCDLNFTFFHPYLGTLIFAIYKIVNNHRKHPQ